MARKQEVFGVTVEGDISGLKKAMNDAVRVFNSTERSLKNVNKALELDPTDESMLAKQRDLYKKAIEENKTALKELKKIRNEIVNDPNFIKGTTEMKEKFTSIELEIKKVTARGKELKKELKAIPSDNIAKVNDKFKKLEETLKNSKKSIETIKKSIENVNKQIDLDPRNMDLYVQKNKLLNDELVATGKAIKDLKKQQDDLNNTPGFLSSNFKSREHVEKMTAIEREIAELVKRYRELEEALRLSNPQLQAFFKTCEKLSDSLNTISQKTKYLSAAFAAMGTAAIKSSMDYESNIANIRRVVSDLSDDTIRDLKDIAIETGNAFKDISDYATIGGALGLAEKDLSKFTKAMIDLNTATGGAFIGEEGAKGIAVFLKQLNLGIEQAENFGSAIAVIGDKYADIGDETVNIATRFTGLTSVVKTNQYELIGLAGVMADLGLATDSNANGINRAFLQIDKVIHGGVKNSTEKLKEMATVAGMTSKEFVAAWGDNAMDAFLRFTDGLKSNVFNEINSALATSTSDVQKYADVLGLSADQFERLWNKDSAKAYEMYVEALGEIGDEGEVASKVLSDLGISSVNTAQTLLRLAGNGNEVRKAIELTEKAWNENTALTEKAGVIYETTEYKLKSMWESIKQLGDAIGQDTLPVIKKFADTTTDLAKQFSKLSPTAKELIVRFVALGASISPVTKGMSLVLKNLPGIITFLSGPGGLIMLTATLATILPTLGREHNLNELMFAMRDTRDEVNLLNNALLDSKRYAEEQYEVRAKELDQYKGEADAIDYLIEKLNTEKLTQQERGEIKERIRQYVENLNNALGDEAFYFDEVNGKIKNQGSEVDTVKNKFAELSAEIKKETWLNAHKGVLEQAYTDLDTSTDKMDSATQNYIEKAKDIPEEIKNAFAQYKGDFEEFKKMLDDNQVEYNEDQLATWLGAWLEYQGAIQDTQALIENANSVIDNYMLVADANVETLDQRINDANESITVMQEGVDNANLTLDDVVLKRETYAATLTEEQKVNDELLSDYDEQIKKLQTQMEYEQQKYNWALDTKAQIQEYIDINNSWVPADKIQNIYVNYIGLRTDFGSGTVNVRSGGFGDGRGMVRSAGFGDLFRSTMASVGRSLGNFKSGGFASGGITVNANFNVNSNNIGRNDVRNWSSWIIDDINEALGKQM